MKNEQQGQGKTAAATTQTTAAAATVATPNVTKNGTSFTPPGGARTRPPAPVADDNEAFDKEWAGKIGDLIT